MITLRVVAQITRSSIFNSTWRIPILLLVLGCTQSLNVLAQDSNEQKYYANSDRNWLAEIPLWVPGFRGQLAYGEFNSSSSGGDRKTKSAQLESKGRLEFYFVGRLAAQYDKLWVQIDAFSGEVGNAFSYTSLVDNGQNEIVDIQVQGTIPRLAIGYSALRKSTKSNVQFELIPYLGARHVSIHLQSDVFDSTDVIDLRPKWTEPVIGLYAPITFKRFKIEVQADYGQSGANNSWVVSNRYRYRISQLVDVQLGWNLIRLYHNGAISGEELESTIRLFGPTAGVGFRF